MATQSEVRKKALQKLRVIGIGQTVNSADGALVDEAYDNLYLQLLEGGSVWWASGDDIPPEAVISIVSLLAATVADEFLPDSQELRIQRLKFEAFGPDQGGKLSALSQLRQMSKDGYVYQPTTVKNY